MTGISNNVLKLLIVLVMVRTALGQSDQFIDTGSLLDRIRKGDNNAVIEAGRSKDPRYIDILRPLADDLSYQARESAVKALAKLGDYKARQYFACRTMTDDLMSTRLLVNYDLAYIGGGFAVEAYRQLLDSDARYRAEIDHDIAVNPMIYFDMILTLPSNWVLLELPKLVPESPVPRSNKPFFLGLPDEPLKTQWKAWLDEHKSDIQKLEPTAEGVRFDPKVCWEVPYRRYRR